MKRTTNEDIGIEDIGLELACVETILVNRLERLKQLRIKAHAEGDIGRSIYNVVFHETTFELMIERMDALIACAEALTQIRSKKQTQN